MSVSRVVNGTRRVSPDVERKVRAAIERIGYVPNEAARILKGNRGSVLGLIVPDLADQFFSTCCSAIQEAAWDAGYMTLMAASNHREQLERQETALMVQRRVAGLLSCPDRSAKRPFHLRRSRPEFRWSRLIVPSSTSIPTLLRSIIWRHLSARPATLSRMGTGRFSVWQTMNAFTPRTSECWDIHAQCGCEITCTCMSRG